MKEHAYVTSGEAEYDESDHSWKPSTILKHVYLTPGDAWPFGSDVKIVHMEGRIAYTVANLDVWYLDVK